MAAPYIMLDEGLYPPHVRPNYEVSLVNNPPLLDGLYLKGGTEEPHPLIYPGNCQGQNPPDLQPIYDFSPTNNPSLLDGLYQPGIESPPILCPGDCQGQSQSSSPTSSWASLQNEPYLHSSTPMSQNGYCPPHTIPQIQQQFGQDFACTLRRHGPAPPGLPLSQPQKEETRARASSRRKSSSTHQSRGPTPASNSTASTRRSKERQNHNTIEKKYRTNINSRIDSLWRALPASSTDPQPCKGDVLTAAKEYILELEKHAVNVERQVEGTKAKLKTYDQLYSGASSC